MFNEEVLTEKLKYLIIMDAPRFEIKSFSLDFVFDSWTKKEKLVEYDVDISFDYNGPLENDVTLFGGDVIQMCEELGRVIGTYGIDKNGKLNAKGENLVYPALIWDITFQADEKHLFNVSYKVVVKDE